LFLSAMTRGERRSDSETECGLCRRATRRTVAINFLGNRAGFCPKNCGSPHRSQLGGIPACARASATSVVDSCFGVEARGCFQAHCAKRRRKNRRRRDGRRAPRAPIWLVNRDGDGYHRFFPRHEAPRRGGRRIVLVDRVKQPVLRIRFFWRVGVLPGRPTVSRRWAGFSMTVGHSPSGPPPTSISLEQGARADFFRPPPRAAGHVVWPPVSRHRFFTRRGGEPAATRTGSIQLGRRWPGSRRSHRNNLNVLTPMPCPDAPGSPSLDLHPGGSGARGAAGVPGDSPGRQTGLLTEAERRERLRRGLDSPMARPDRWPTQRLEDTAKICGKS